MSNVSLKFTKNMINNSKQKSTNIEVLQQQIKRTKHTVNQTQKLIKLLIEKVDTIQMFIMSNWFITENTQSD